MTSNSAPTLVFVHGTHVSSFSWVGLTQELTLRGYRTIAVDLPGHGIDGFYPRAYQAPQDLAALAKEPSPLAALTLDDYAAHVEDVVRRARRNGPVVLVGASQGGVTLSRVGNAVPELLDHIVYMAAYCPVDLPSMVAYLATPENAGSLVDKVTAAVAGDPAELGVARVNWRTADQDLLDGIRECLAARFTDEELTRTLNLFQPDESVAIPMAETRVEADRWGRIPRTYVRFTEDRLIPPALQDRFIAEADRLTPGNPTEVHSVAAPHVGPFYLPEIVEILSGLARRSATRP
ncbi:alpha/beta fold hydrolase [Glycomyces algeriensis]|uniref:Esterase n=1 Tax=Glycomyces algeriensis TaxID=256037 RepID=A0A9W6G5C8_9ACTN|nr:alpha/beta fold hydrolase [Glycomyces algeriensis]MDA1367606.1 alpha/beta fold hydrolase [Glycomyces algeriensis]MDR7353031.1 pimeloyl-ACP methyl ester carboxylesterase [Glycomyces algeriensis]GLI40721.1 esterase [Glycomyces algeriensis]